MTHIKPSTLRTLIQNFLQDESGNAVLEYGLITGAVGVAGAASVNQLADTYKQVYDHLNSQIATALLQTK